MQPQISKNHLVKLEKESGISHNVAEQNVRTVTTKQAHEKVGFGNSGMEFPYYDLNGDYIGSRVRFDVPRKDKAGKQIRYGQKKDVDLKLYFPLEHLTKIMDDETPLLLVEGEKKALSAATTFQDDYAVISVPGCWNWKDKGEMGLSKAFDNLPLLNRKIVWCPDTDIFSNSKVQKAYLQMSKALYRKGARLILIDLRMPCWSEKMGFDDLIVNFGKECLLPKLRAPAWIFDKSARLPQNANPDQIVDFYRKRIFTNYIDLSIEIQNELEHGDYAKDGIQNAKCTEAKNAFYKILPEYFRYRDVITWYKNTESAKSVSKRMGKFIELETEIYACTESQSAISIDPSKEKFEYISNPRSFSHLISTKIQYAEASRPTEPGKLKYCVVPENIAGTFLSDITTFMPNRRIKSVTYSPFIIKNQIISGSGFLKELGIYSFIPQDLKTSPPNLIFKVMESFPFKDDASFANAFSLFFNYMLRCWLIGDRPITIINGDTQNLGKSTLARFASLIMEPNPPAEIPFPGKDEELGKVLCSLLQKNNSVLIDNIDQSVSSSILASNLTSPKLSFRLLGGNQIFERTNDVVFVATLNNGQISKDIQRGQCLCLSVEAKTQKEAIRNPSGLQMTIGYNFSEN
jgi:hypothetical protein